MNAFSKAFCKALLIFFAVIVSFNVNGQDRKEELRVRKAHLQDEIQLANKILEEARQNRQTSVTALQTLNQKLRIRQDLLRTIDREVVLIDVEIEKQEAEVEKLRLEVDTLKEKYAEMIRLAYKNKSKTSRLMFVFSSSSFDQAMRRIQYLRQYGEFRRQQVERIEQHQLELERQIELLNQQKEEKEKLRTQKEEELRILNTEKEEQRSSIASLQEREGTLQEQIRNKQAEANRLENEIQRIIAEEIRRERARAERLALEERALAAGLSKGKDYNDRTTNARLTELIAAARARNSSTSEPVAEPENTASYALTPEAARLARNFEANKGQLPWPVERGILVGKFGNQPHPVVPGITINNPHIEIGTASGAQARATFDGVVLDVIRIPGAPITVIIQHGNYYSHYGNLGESFVKRGDRVTAKQAIGKVFTDPNGNETVLQFGLWKNTDLMDPYPWLAK